MNKGKLKTKQIFLLTLAVCISLFSKVYAQNTSFMRQTNTTLTNSEQQIRTTYSAIANYSNLTNIEVLSLKDLQSNGKVDLILPSNISNCGKLTFYGTDINYTDENNYYWYGIVDIDEEGGCKDASLQLIAKDGLKYGKLTIDKRTFEYFPLSASKQILFEVLPDDLGGGGGGGTEGGGQVGVYFCPNIGGANLTTSINPDLNRTEACVDQQVRILVLWTANAAAVEPNMAARIDLAIQETNQAYRNSLVDPTSANLVLAGSQLLAGYVETGNTANDVATLTNNITAQNLRNTTGADIVILMTNGNYGRTLGRVADIGPNNNLAYGIVQVRTATGNPFIFAHEVAHLFGCRHTVAQDPTGTIQHGYTFWTRNWFLGAKTNRYTIMSVPPIGELQEQNYSNPDVKIKKKATGTNDRENNAQQHRLTGPIVANFRNNPNLQTRIDFGNFNGGCYPNQAEAVTKCGTAPYSYLWEDSYDGINYQPHSTNEIWQVGGGCPTAWSYTYWVRLSVTDVNGVTATSIRWVPIFSTLFPFRQSSTNITTSAKSTNETPKVIEDVFPNPNFGNGKIVLNSNEKGTAKITISDFNGNIKFIINNYNLTIGRNIVNFNINSIVDGTYMIRFAKGNYIESKSIIINKK
jgi:hypothetical protein